MSRKRESEFKKPWISFFRLLTAITMLQYLVAGAIPSLAAPAEVTDFDLMQSVDLSTWTAVSGDLGNGFTMPLDPTEDWYYLNVANLVADPGLKEAYHPFYVTSTPSGWLAYWNDRGVNAGASGWQAWMYQIITGNQPIFYLRVTSGPNYMLVDGLSKDAIPPYADTNLRINGDYLLGDYTFTGTITDTTETTSTLAVDITFSMIQRQLNVTKDGTGSGTVTSEPAGIDCGTGAGCQSEFDHGTVVTLTATADTGSTFAGWSGEGCSGTGDCTVTMTGTRSVTATFTLEQYTLSVTKTGTGSGTVTSDPAGINCGSGAGCQHDYDYGTVVTLTATAACRVNLHRLERRRMHWRGPMCRDDQRS